MPAHPLYHYDLRRVHQRVATTGPGTPATTNPHLNHRPHRPTVEYRARARYANTHHTTLHDAETRLLALLDDLAHTGHTHPAGTFHELVGSGHLLVLDPEASTILEYGHLTDQTSPSTEPTTATTPQPAAPQPAAPSATSPTATTRTRSETPAVTFDSAVLTWAGAAPGQSHTKLAHEIRGSITAALATGDVKPGRDGTHVTDDGTWRVVLNPTRTKALFAARTEPLPGTGHVTDPDHIATSDLPDALTSACVDNLIITPTILAAAEPASGQSLEDLRTELLDAVDAALEDGHLTPGFSGRHQLYGDGWLLVLSPAGTHMVTARRSR